MEFRWENKSTEPISLKEFLKNKGLSKRLLAKVKFEGGSIYVDDIERTVRYRLQENEVVRLVLPKADPQDSVQPYFDDITILYEDEHVLVVNKEAGVASIPSFVHPSYSMANRVKGYYISQNYEHRMIHVVTRLDRDTSGVMLFAKHSFAHAQLDKQLRDKKIQKFYVAIAPKSLQLNESGFFDEPIGRDDQSIMIRKVVEDGSGKSALTQYWRIGYGHLADVYRIQLHTGRTHQIRVHFSYHQAPLIGDDLYGGNMTTSIKRQALHCSQLTFFHPFTDEEITIAAPLSDDLQTWIDKEITWKK